MYRARRLSPRTDPSTSGVAKHPTSNSFTDRTQPMRQDEPQSRVLLLLEQAKLPRTVVLPCSLNRNLANVCLSSTPCRQGQPKHCLMFPLHWQCKNMIHTPFPFIMHSSTGTQQGKLKIFFH